MLQSTPKITKIICKLDGLIPDKLFIPPTEWTDWMDTGDYTEKNTLTKTQKYSIKKKKINRRWSAIQPGENYYQTQVSEEKKPILHDNKTLISFHKMISFMKEGKKKKILGF